MKYRLVHQTIHKYRTPVSVGNHIACLTPRTLPWQHSSSYELIITPQPATLTERIDYFGNRLTLFTVQQSHHKLTLESRSELQVLHPPKWPEITPPWEQVAADIRTDTSAAGLDAYQFVFESPRIRPKSRVRIVRQAIVYERPDAGRCAPRSDAKNPQRIQVRFESYSRRHDTRRSASEEAGSLPGLRPSSGGMFAGVESACAICERIHSNLSTARAPSLGRSGCIPCLGVCLLSGRRLARCRSDEQPCTLGRSCYPRLGPRLWRCQSASGLDPWRSSPHIKGGCRLGASRGIAVNWPNNCLIASE